MISDLRQGTFSNKLNKKFGKLDVLKDIDLECNKGQCIALIGPNGCGKTTLIKSILGMVLPDKGNIEYEGKSVLGEYLYREKIGYMPQIGRFPDNMKASRLIQMMKDIRNADENTDEELFKAFQIESIGQKTMQSLSGGTRQKVNATLAFLFNPEVLILDEPTAGLDPVSSEILKQKIIREATDGKLVLITSHILSDLEDVATNVIYLQEGKIHFSDSLENIQEYTGQIRLGKAIAQLMQQGFRKDIQSFIK